VALKAGFTCLFPHVCLPPFFRRSGRIRVARFSAVNPLRTFKSSSLGAAVNSFLVYILPSPSLSPRRKWTCEDFLFSPDLTPSLTPYTKHCRASYFSQA